MSSSTDRIEKRVVLNAPRSRVWRAISNAAEFGSWFGVKFSGPFTPGTPLRGTITPTTVDAKVAESQATYAGADFEITVDRIEPEHLFSFRWHPFAVDPKHDYADEPMTLVVFELEEVAGGTQLTIVESGFDGIPAARRARAFEMNEGGWTAQAMLIEKYVTRAQ
jgi:uncharacterized protein YndB with AHSA1/START domain